MSNLRCPSCGGTGILTIKETDIGAIFKLLRTTKDVSLRDVEKVTGLSNAYLSQIETGKVVNPSFEVVSILCKYYGITTGQLAGEDHYIRNAR